MRNSIKFSGAILTAILAVACAKAELEKPAVSPENPVGGGEAKIDTLYSTLEQAGGTKLSLSDDKDLKWQKGDFIYVLQKGKDNAIFKLIGEGGKTSGSFEGTLQEGETPYYVLFAREDEASQGNASVSDNELKFKVLQDKPAQSDDITSQGFPAVAELSGNSMQFHNIFGLLKLTLSSQTDVKINKITLHDLAGNMLWGDCIVPIDDNGNLQYDKIKLEKGDNTISMKWNNYTRDCRLMFLF